MPCAHLIFRQGDSSSYFDQVKVKPAYLHQGRSQNVEKFTHVKGKLLDQAVVLFNCAPFQIGTSLKGKNLLLEGANSFL